MQVEQLFSVAQRRTAEVETLRARQVSVMDLKRATTIGIRMSRLKYALLFVEPRKWQLEG